MSDVIDIKEGKRIRKMRMHNGGEGDRDTSITIHIEWPRTARGIAGALVYFVCPIWIVFLAVWIMSKLSRKTP